MKKMIVCLCAYLVVAFSYKVVSADEGMPLVTEARVENYISQLYKQIDFSKSTTLSYDVFDKAFRGYLNLRNSGKLNTETEVISVCDFSLPSTENRLWVIDLAKRKVLFNTYVAHGEGSGDDSANSFSNAFNSHKSSLGFYVTGDIYQGEHGTSLRLNGMDVGFNDAAYDRGVVVHGADYVGNKFVASHNRLGRSWGCPAVPTALYKPIIDVIKYGTCLFIYYPDNKYLASTSWLNRKITRLPENNMLATDLPKQTPKPTVRVIEYVHNGVVDSVKRIQLETTNN
jgi:hypothetical protein